MTGASALRLVVACSLAAAMASSPGGTTAAAGGTAAAGSTSTGVASPAAPWPPATSPDATVQDLHREYWNIFKYGNRNAASHRWSTFLLDRAAQMTQERLELMFSGFCAVSGSPIRPHDYSRYRLTLPTLSGGWSTGYMHYCCWPCVCDTQDFIRVDTRNVTTSEGTRQVQFVVIGNPCDHPEQLTTPFKDTFGRGETSIAASAQEVRCAGGVLEGATMSDHGYVIINMFFDAVDAVAEDSGIVPGAQDAISDPTPGRVTKGGGGALFQDEREFAPLCAQRAAAGFNSGMGEIFRRVCSVSPIVIAPPALHITGKDAALPTDSCEAEPNRVTA